ncbi:MAG: VWA domain-containing protein [Acidobacteriota bacterium]|nr:VWA domain-containing protein [Acidobacteriota bacterium]
MNAVASKFLAATLALLLCMAAGLPARAQAPEGPQGGQPQQAPPPPVPAQNPTKKPPQQPPPEAGVTIAVDVPVVTLDVIATTKNGDILTGLKKENFKVLDDGAPQTITNFAPSDAPITIVIVMEFSGRAYGWFAAYAKYWADALFPNLQAQDWVALETFDMRTRLEVDFTQDKNEVRAAINRLYFPGFSESNVFDALLETNERLKDVKGKKSILLLASGVDTFSKHTLDQTMKQLRQSDVTIFSVGLDKTFTNFLDSRGSLSSHMDYLQAENQLKAFSQETGGFSWFPQFDGEIPGIFQQVAAFLRHQYSISYTPGNGAKDGKFHKVKVELVAPDGSPLTVLDQKGKKQKYVVYARDGYQAPKGGVGD